MSGWIPRSVAASALVAVCVSGCARSNGSSDSVSAADLQRGIAEQLARSGTPSTWINCAKSLPAQVGATARCDVAFNSVDSVTAVLTTTGVDGGKVDWEVTGPKLTNEQVAKRVAGGAAALGVTCDSGLDGRVGDWVRCQASRNGVAATRIAEVTGVNGLAVNVSVHPVLLKQEAERQLLARVTTSSGQPVQDASCSGDLLGIVGSTVDCAVRSGDGLTGYVLKVTGIVDGSVAFDAISSGPT